jgi:hypothetical protein
MGGHPYWYITPYQSDINSALQRLRKQEFEAGRYNPVNPFPFDPNLNERVKARTPDSGNYGSIEEAAEAAMECGTRSILDIEEVSDEPDMCVASPISKEYLLRFFRTEQPSRQMIEAILAGESLADDNQEIVDYEDDINDLFDLIDRGEGRYIIIYDGDRPSEILFAGYSFD